MGLSVSVNLEAYPEGVPLGIVGIGVVENGGTLEVDPVMEEVFFSMNGNTIENVLKDQEGMDVSGSAEFQTPEGWEAPEPPVTEDETTPVEPEPTPEPIRPASGLPEPTPEPPTEEGA